MAIKRTNLGAAATLPVHDIPGDYLYTASPMVSTTSGALAVGTLRLVPWVITRTLAITRLGAEVFAAGEAGALVRLGIYADSGHCYPGNLYIDAGTIAADSTGAKEITISTTLPPGLWWIGGVVQAVVTTQPTMRTCSNWTPPVPIGVGTSLASATNNLAIGNSAFSVTAALPATFTSSVTASATAIRTFVRVG